MAEPKYLTVEHLSLKRIIRIFSSIAVSPETGCWEWTGWRLKGKYGQTYYNGRHELAHRLMYAWLVGPIPMGRGRHIPQLDHVVCNNPPCCNPAHLKLVSLKANLMRGTAPCAVNAKKTHCKNGHPFTDLPGKKYAKRVCKICRSIYNHERRHGPLRQRTLECDRQYHRKRRAQGIR